MTNLCRKMLLLLLLLTACGTAPPPTAEPDTFYVDATQSLGEISPYIYGVNHGPWAIITERTLPLAQEAGITMVRYPGGEWGDENDIQPYHLDQFVLLAEQLGAEVSLNARLHNGTPEKAAALVHSANVEQGYGIRYWGIGNEPTLYATRHAIPDYGVERFNAEWREIAEAMRAVDPDILLIGPELHQYGPDLASTPKDPFGLDWMTEFLKANGDLVDVVSIHRYPFPQGQGGRAATIPELRETSVEWDAIIPYLRGLIQETTGRDLPIAITEVNSHWSNAIGGEATPDSHLNAIWWADCLGRMINQNVAIVNYFSLQSHPSIGGYGIFARSEPRPTYYTYRLYREFGSQRVYAASDVAYVGVYAARRDDGALTVMLVNLADEAITRPLVARGQAPAQAELWRLDATTSAERLDDWAFTSGAQLTLPAESVTLLIIRE